MSSEILMPKLGFSMNEGMIAEWLAQDGDAIAEGQPLYSVESGKSVQEIEAAASGILRILVPAGETIAVGTTIGLLK